MKPISEHTGDSVDPVQATPETIKFLRKLVSDIDYEIEALTAKKRVLVEVLEEVDGEHQEVEQAPLGNLSVQGAVIENAATDATYCQATSTPQEVDESKLDIDLSELDVSIVQNAPNLLDRMTRIALAIRDEGKLLNVTQVARYLNRAGVTLSSIQNQRTSMGKVLREHPELFEKVRLGTFRYLGNGFHSSPDSASDVQYNESTDSVDTANLSEEVNNP